MSSVARFAEFSPYLRGNGDIIVPKIYHFAPGTSSQKNAWLERNKLNTAPQPIEGDAAGIASGFFDGLYKIQVRDENDIVLYTYDGFGESSIWTGAFIDVTDPAYGASPNNTPAQNSVALQAAIDAAVAAEVATIVVPGGERYEFDTPLVQAPVSGQTHINWLGVGGAGAAGVTLHYTGSGGTALTIKNNTRYSFKNIRIQDGATGARGLFLTSVDVGSNHGPALFENVFITGFTTDVQIGDTDNRAASEIMFVMCEFDSATTGCLVQGPASGTSFSTSIRFIGVQAVNCGTVIKVAGDKNGTPIKLSVWGFSFSENTLEFDLQVPGTYRITDGYAEHSTSGQFLKSGSGTATENSALVTKVALESVITNYPASPSNFVALFYQPGNYAVRECSLSTGSIQIGGYDGGAGPRKSSLVIDGSTIVPVAGAPVQYKASSNTIWSVRHVGSGDTNTEATNTDEERHYVIDTAGAEFTIAKFGAWSASAGGDALKAALGTRIVATASLPAASADMNGTHLIEDAGAGVFNHIVYAGGARYRRNGYAAF